MPSRLPPLNSLRAFEVAARHLSFRKAAAELHVTPAAISHQIKTLEEFLGVSLFHRRTRGLELTDSARACLPRLRQGFELMIEAVALLRHDRDRAVLNVGVAPSLAVKWLAPRIHQFIFDHPEFDVRLAASAQFIDSAHQPSGAEDFDVAIRFGSGLYPGLETGKLFSLSVTPICSPRLLEGKYALRRPDDLRHHTLLHDDTIAPENGRPDWETWLKHAGVDGVDVSRGPHFNHAVLALDAAADHAGVVLSYPVLAFADVAAGRLVMPFQLNLPLDLAYYVVSDKANAGRADVAAFRDWLFAQAAADGIISALPSAAAHSEVRQ